MSEIKRYAMWSEARGYDTPGTPMRDGDWVRHADHLAAVESANAMRIELVTQIDNLCDLADRYARLMHKRGDADERDYILGGIEHAIKATAPFKYNGPWQGARTTQPAEGAK